MIVRNDLIEAERIEKPTLALLQPPHHRPPPQRIVSERRNHPPHKPSTTFCNKIGTKPTPPHVCTDVCFRRQERKSYAPAELWTLRIPTNGLPVCFNSRRRPRP